MDISFMTVLKSFYIIYSSFLIFATADDLGFCSDPFCKDPVGFGVTTQFYHANEGSKLSFIANQNVEIFVKDYGEKKNLLGVSLNGKKGFVPKTFVRETSTKQHTLVPAEIKFGDEIGKPSNVVDQESQIPNQILHNQIPDAGANDQASNQNRETLQENSFNPTVNLLSNENQYIPTSPQAPPPSNEGLFDNQLGGYQHQQPNQHQTNPPQQSLDTSIPINSQQQFSSLETSYSPTFQYADIDTAQQHNVPDVGSTAQQQPESQFSSHNDFISNTDIPMHNGMNTEQYNAQPPINEGYFGSQFGGYAHQQPSPHLSNTPQQSEDSSIPINMHQQFGDSRTPYSPPFQSADTNTAHHHNVPDVGNTVHQHSESQFPSQSFS